jgi:hypothetical protein
VFTEIDSKNQKAKKKSNKKRTSEEQRVICERYIFSKPALIICSKKQAATKRCDAIKSQTR